MTTETANQYAAMMADLLVITARLRDVMLEELQALEKPKLPNMQKITEEKSSLITLYRARVQTIRADTTFAKMTDPALKIKLRDNMAALAEVARALNDKLLRRRHINEGIIQAIGAHMVQKTTPVQGYGKDGHLRTLTPIYRAAVRPASIALNQAV